MVLNVVKQPSICGVVFIHPLHVLNEPGANEDIGQKSEDIGQNRLTWQDVAHHENSQQITWPFDRLITNNNQYKDHDILQFS